jgi:ATP-dependent exoDNAse (exonuclease V) beta subunit
MEDVVWLEEHERTNEELKETIMRFTSWERVTGLEAEGAIGAFHAALDCPEIQTLLAREAQEVLDGAELEVSNERTFSLVLNDEEGSEHFANGSIDRLVLTLEDGVPIAAEVIDFKTDRITVEEVPARAEHHAAQMNAYRHAVAAMYDLAPEKVTLRLAFFTPGVVHDLL